MTKIAVSTLLLCSLAGTAFAQPVIDGTKDALYGSAKWVNSVPTSEPDNVLTACDRNVPGGLPNNVTTGFEIAIPLSAIGSPAGTFRVAGFVNGGGSSFLSNQVIGTAAVGPTGQLAEPPNFGEPRLVDFAAVPGDQFATLNAASSQPTNAPTLDGSRDTTYTLAGFRVSSQTARTGFGDADHGSIDGPGAGSEIDAVYYRIKSGVLYLLITGNLETNGNRLDIFFDSVAGGQQQLLGDSPIIGGDANSLNRMGAGAEGPGLNFDAAFTADYHLTINLSGGAPFRAYADFASIGPSGVGSYLGYREAGAANAGAFADPEPANGASNPSGIAMGWNNSNIAGVDGFCQPTGGNPAVANGAEMDALYFYDDAANQRVYVMITGNAQSDYSNAWSLFFDVGTTTTTIPGNPPLISAGQNVLRSDSPDVDFGSFNAMGTGADPLLEPGLTFDADFAADYVLSYKTGNASIDGTTSDQYVHTVVLRDGGPYKPAGIMLDYGSFDGGARATHSPVDFDGMQGFPAGGYDIQDGFINNLYSNYGPRTSAQNMINAYPNFPTTPPNGLIVATFDNSNIAGITGTTANSSDALAVTTGLEFSISYAELGWDGSSPLKLAGFINSDGGRTGVSTNILGDPAAGAPFLNSRTVNFTTTAGTQYVVLNSSGGDTCPADFNDDTFVDDSDFVTFAACYEAFIAEGPCAVADFNADGFVDDTDFVTFAAAYEAFVCP